MTARALPSCRSGLPDISDPISSGVNPPRRSAPCSGLAAEPLRGPPVRIGGEAAASVDRNRRMGNRVNVRSAIVLLIMCIVVRCFPPMRLLNHGAPNFVAPGVLDPDGRKERRGSPQVGASIRTEVRSRYCLRVFSASWGLGVEDPPLVDEVAQPLLAGINANIDLIHPSVPGRPLAHPTPSPRYSFVDLVWHELEFRERDSFTYPRATAHATTAKSAPRR